jgi:hypothetical protein
MYNIGLISTLRTLLEKLGAFACYFNILSGQDIKYKVLGIAFRKRLEYTSFLAMKTPRDVKY